MAQNIFFFKLQICEGCATFKMNAFLMVILNSLVKLNTFVQTSYACIRLPRAK